MQQSIIRILKLKKCVFEGKQAYLWHIEGVPGKCYLYHYANRRSYLLGFCHKNKGKVWRTRINPELLAWEPSFKYIIRVIKSNVLPGFPKPTIADLQLTELTYTP